MSIFRRSNNGKIKSSGSDNIVYDFTLRAPFWSYRPIDYHEYEPFLAFGSVIDSCLTKQFEGVVDAGNGETLKNDIHDIANQALADLSRQQIEHENRIHEFYHRRCADRASFEYRLSALENELQKTLRGIKEAEERYRKNKFKLYGGNPDV